MARVSRAALAAVLVGGALSCAGAPAQGLIVSQKLSAVLASELVGNPVVECAKKNYAVTATVVDLDRVRQAVLRDDGAPIDTYCAATGLAIEGGIIPPRTKQLLVVTTDSWGATKGLLIAYYRTDDNKWARVDRPDISVILGDKGLGWAPGLLSIPIVWIQLILLNMKAMVVHLPDCFHWVRCIVIQQCPS